MAQIRVTSGTDLAVRIILMFVVLMVVELLAVAVDPPVRYVLSATVIQTSTASFVVAGVLFCCCIALIPGDADQNMGALSTFAYVLGST